MSGVADVKLITHHFIKTFHVKLGSDAYIKQAAIVKNLLTKYSVDEIIFTIDKLLAQGKEITSLGYLSYVIENYAKEYRLKYAEKEIEQMKMPEPTQETKTTDNKDKSSGFGIKRDYWGGR